MNPSTGVGIALGAFLAPLIKIYVWDPLDRFWKRSLPEGRVKRVLLFEIGKRNGLSTHGEPRKSTGEQRRGRRSGT